MVGKEKEKIKCIKSIFKLREVKRGEGLHSKSKRRNYMLVKGSESRQSERSRAKERRGTNVVGKS